MASLTEIYSTLLSTAPFAVTLLVLFIFIEQISYLRKKSFIPGPSLILPFVGNVYSLVNDPTKFWFVQSDYTKSSPLGISANYVIGKFMVFIRSTELSHKVFANVRPDAFHLIGHPFGKKLFGTHNMIYLFGQEHKDLRRRIVPNFTPKALSVYTAAQYTVILRHLRRWHRLCAAAAPKPIALRFLARDMNLETSQTVFAGPYLNEEERRRFNKDYSLFNEGLMKLPIDFPGTAFRNARNAVDRLVDTLTVCAVRSKERMVNGDEPPRCLIDFWMQETVREEREAAECRAPPPPHSGNREIGSHIFDFLFAAQDASTSSLLWAVTLLDAHPEVLSKVREEVRGIWNPEMGIPLTAENLGELKYTHAVAREILRYRAPATLVPHIAGEDFKLTEDYTIPKGTIVFPSVYESSFQGFPHPERFDPDRFYIEERKEDVLYKRNFLVFGAGAHQCVGQRYALNHLVLFISMFATCMDFKRQRSDGCDDLSYNPTICPKDDCLVSLSMTVN